MIFPEPELETLKLEELNLDKFKICALMAHSIVTALTLKEQSPDKDIFTEGVYASHKLLKKSVKSNDLMQAIACSAYHFYRIGTGEVSVEHTPAAVESSKAFLLPKTILTYGTDLPWYDTSKAVLKSALVMSWHLMAQATKDPNWSRNRDFEEIGRLLISAMCHAHAMGVGLKVRDDIAIVPTEIFVQLEGDTSFGISIEL